LKTDMEPAAPFHTLAEGPRSGQGAEGRGGAGRGGAGVYGKRPKLLEEEGGAVYPSPPQISVVWARGEWAMIV